MSAALVLLLFLAALLYASVGHGGASGYLAVMALFGVAPATMKPGALALNVLVATVALVQFARAGAFEWRLFWPFALVSVPGAFLGGRVPPAGFYGPLVGVVLLFAAWRLGASSRTPEVQRKLPVPVALAVGAALGFLSGLTGVGGGIFLSPLLLLSGWAEPRRTAGVSAAFILVNSLAGLAGRVTSLAELPSTFPAWAAAALLGGVIGATYGSKRLANPTLRRLLALVLVVAGLKMVAT
jgi:hypothetical protein